MNTSLFILIAGCILLWLAVGPWGLVDIITKIKPDGKIARWCQNPVKRVIVNAVSSAILFGLLFLLLKL